MSAARAASLVSQKLRRGAETRAHSEADCLRVVPAVGSSVSAAFDSAAEAEVVASVKAVVGLAADLFRAASGWVGPGTTEGFTEIRARADRSAGRHWRRRWWWNGAAWASNICAAANSWADVVRSHASSACSNIGAQPRVNKRLRLV